MPLNEAPFDQIEHFRGKIVHLRRNILDPVDEEIIGDHGRDCSEQPGGRGNQGVSNPGSYNLDRSGPLHSESLESADDPYDSPEKPDERGDGCRRGQPAHVSFQDRQLCGSRPLQSPLNAVDITIAQRHGAGIAARLLFPGLMRLKLLVQLLVGSSKQTGQGRVAKMTATRTDLAQSRGASEEGHEAAALMLYLL